MRYLKSFCLFQNDSRSDARSNEKSVIDKVGGTANEKRDVRGPSPCAYRISGFQ